jgi:trimethylamine---corrinoid protein Co-methyltransferase
MFPISGPKNKKVKNNMPVRLSEKDIRTLYDTSCRILEEVGIIIRDEGAMETLCRAGATRKPWNIVIIPRQLVEKAIESAPSYFFLYDRNGGRFEIGKGKHHHAVGGTMTQVLEYPGLLQRSATLRDLVELVRLCDMLALIDIVVPVVEPQDADRPRREIIGFAETFKNTTKHCLTAPLTSKTAEAWVRMANIAAGNDTHREQPVISMVAAIMPGLEIDAESARIMMLAARSGIPLVLMAGSLAGAQSPITLAGSVGMANAATLAGLTLNQCVKPGSPVSMYCGCQVVDLRSGELSEAGPENTLGASALAQLARFYQIPTYACAADTDAKIGNVQAGMEKMAGMFGALSDGIDITINAGALGRASTASPEQLIIDHEMLVYLERIERGIHVDEETLALDTIRALGPRGDYMDVEHTRRFLRTDENVYFEIFDRTACRKSYEDIYTRANERCRDLLMKFNDRVPEEVKINLDKFVRQYK